MCLENVIYITKQEKVSIYYLGPFLGEFVRVKRKPNFGNVIGQRKNSPRKSWISSYSFTCRFARTDSPSGKRHSSDHSTSTLKLSDSRNFYRLRMTSTNVFTISCLSIEPNPSPRFGKFISTARCKALQSLYCTIRRLFALFVDYSRTIRTIRRLFALFASLF